MTTEKPKSVFLVIADGLDALVDGRGWSSEHEAAKVQANAAPDFLAYLQILARSARFGECMTCALDDGANYERPDSYEDEACPKCGGELLEEQSGADVIEWYESQIEGARMTLIRAGLAE